MRRAVTTTSHELIGLCAACARKELATSSSSASRASLLTAKNYSKTSEKAFPSRLKPSSFVSSRRWLSTSPSRAQQEDARDQSSSSQPKWDHAPLPYYALFPQTLPDGPPPKGPFSIDTRVLRREFLQLQAASHPDFHHSASQSTSSSSSHSTSRRKAEALSSHINSAYKTLSSPLLRAQYILASRYGTDLAGDEASTLTGPADPDLLTEVLYARETIEEAGSEKDLEGVRAENETRIEACLKSLEEAFAGEDIARATRETVRLRYWVNIRESVDNWEEGRPVVLQH